ncbi:MAG: TlpA disulfide reductase family protein, partial [Acidobacteriota bacterium]
AASQHSAGGLAEGDTMPPLELAGLDGSTTSVTFEGAERESFLLVFDTSCAACDQNLDHWLDLHARYGERYRFLAISLDEPQATRDYAERKELPFEVVLPTDPYFAGSVGIVGVPETVRVGRDGRVEALHLGVLPDDWLAWFS